MGMFVMGVQELEGVQELKAIKQQFLLRATVEAPPSHSHLGARELRVG